MRTLTLDNTALDLQAQDNPFNPGATIVALNLTGGPLIVQQADDSAFSENVETVGTVGANETLEITPTRQYLRVSTSADVTLLGN